MNAVNNMRITSNSMSNVVLNVLILHILLIIYFWFSRKFIKANVGAKDNNLNFSSKYDLTPLTSRSKVFQFY